MVMVDSNKPKKLATVNTILKNIFLHSENSSKEVDEELFFRGESCPYGFRLPSLYREEKLVRRGSEYYYRTLLNELGRDDYTENTSLVRMISELQHYGAKTRMLDITKSPLVALYFAVEKDDDKPGFIHIYGVERMKEKFDTGHTVAIKSALNFMPQDIIDDFLIVCHRIEKKLDNGNIEILGGVPIIEMREKINNYIRDEEGEKTFNKLNNFMNLLNQRARTREKLVYPFKIYKDLISSQIVLPSKTTERIRQQQGAFIYPSVVSTKRSDGVSKEYVEIQQEISGSIDEFATELHTNKEDKKTGGTVSFSVIQIDGKRKEKIRKQLELLGITSGYMYPDIEHQSRALIDKLNVM